MTIPFDVPRDGFYEVIAQIAQSPDYGDYVATLDGKQTNSTLMTWGPLQTQAPPAEIIHNYQPETFVGVDHRLGWFKLSKGRHTVALSCVGKETLATGYNLGVDSIVLEEIPNGEALVNATGAGTAHSQTVEEEVPLRRPVRGIVYRGEPLGYYLSRVREDSGPPRAEDVRAIGAFGTDAAAAIGTLTGLLTDQDTQVRAAAALALGGVGPAAAPSALAVAKLLHDGDVRVQECAALALRGMGHGAAPAVPELIAALRDPTATVRMSAALTLGAVGPAARSAVPALTALVDIPDESKLTNDGVQVVRNAAYALGDIGPAARPAIPALQKINHVRIHYIAQEAVAKIEGRPAATWH